MLLLQIYELFDKNGNLSSFYLLTVRVLVGDGLASKRQEPVVGVTGLWGIGARMYTVTSGFCAAAFPNVCLVSVIQENYLLFF